LIKKNRQLWLAVLGFGVDLKITKPSFRQRWWKAIKIKPEGA